MLINGDTLGADTIIFDLEDAVSPDEKDAARILVRNALKYQSFPNCEVVVRINPTDTEFWKEDLKAIIPLKPDVVMPTKVSGGEMIRQVADYITEVEKAAGVEEGSVKILPLIETALGVEKAFDIASASGLSACFWEEKTLLQTCTANGPKRARKSFMPEHVWYVRPEPAALKPMTRRLPMWRIWKAWKKIPNLPRVWDLQEKR